MKRRIKLGDIEKIVLSNTSDELVLKVPSEYDLKLINVRVSFMLAYLELQELKDEFVEVLKVLYYKVTFSELEIETHDGTVDAVFSKSKRRMSVASDSFGALSDEKVSIDDFDLVQEIGQGAFGKVLKVRKKNTGRVYAMKILKKSFLLKTQQVESTMAERHIDRKSVV